MEILSTGEKINRARVYKGLTLKDICQGRISISKMSCIENNKILPDQVEMEFIAEILDLDVAYLSEDTRDQVIKNMKELEKAGYTKKYEEDMFYNLEVAKHFDFLDLEFEIIHCLFVYYLDINSIKGILNILPPYYEIFLLSNNEKYKFQYNFDVGNYLSLNCEYQQAISYYNDNVVIANNNKMYIEIFVAAELKIFKCLVMLKKHDKAYEVAFKLLDYVDYIQDEDILSRIYHNLAIICLKTGGTKPNGKDFHKYDNLANSFGYSNALNKAESIYDYAIIYFETGEFHQAKDLIMDAIDNYPKDNEVRLTRFLLRSVKVLVDYEAIDLAAIYCDEALNLAIAIENDELMERNYYYKSLILFKQKEYISAEVYFNLSLEFLCRFGKNRDLYNRYLEVGQMYHMVGDTSEALKYFSMAITLKKRK